jgi:peptide/nickel transport system ATP-binding protein
MTDTLLAARGLGVTYRSPGFPRARIFDAIRNVDFDIARGEALGLVGESGSGKTTLGRAILGLAPVSAGELFFAGRPIHCATRQERRALSSEIQVIFQDPYSSLNPAMTIEAILAEPLLVQGMTRADARDRITELLDRVHMPRTSLTRVPREFSGGQRQRIAIARAIAIRPKLIVCDEPVSALDLTTQAHVLELMIEIQKEFGISYLFISHDLSVVRHICHRVMVMLNGEIVESGQGDLMTTSPSHPYSKRLLMSAPVCDPKRQRERRRILRELDDEKS